MMLQVEEAQGTHPSKWVQVSIVAVFVVGLSVVTGSVSFPSVWFAFVCSMLSFQSYGSWQLKEMAAFSAQVRVLDKSVSTRTCKQ